jgi:hypothetical protein
VTDGKRTAGWSRWRIKGGRNGVAMRMRGRVHAGGKESRCRVSKRTTNRDGTKVPCFQWLCQDLRLIKALRKRGAQLRSSMDRAEARHTAPLTTTRSSTALQRVQQSHAKWIQTVVGAKFLESGFNLVYSIPSAEFELLLRSDRVLVRGGP